MSIVEGKEFCREERKIKSFPSLLQLSEDLRTIFHEGLANDIVLFTDGKYIKCHKAILSTRSHWFSMKIRQICVPGINIIKVCENSKILDAVLLYIYTGNLELLEALDIPLIDVRNAADKYGLSNLKRITTDIIKFDKADDETKFIEFGWNVKVDSRSPLIYDCPDLKNFSLHGSDTWGLEIQPLFHGDGTCIIGVYLKRKTSDESCKVVHFVSARVYVLNVNGSKKLSFKAELAISEDMKFKLAEFALEIEQNCGVLNPDSTINLSCELKISGKLGAIQRFQLKGEFNKYVSKELLHLSRDMLQMLKLGKYSDTSIQLKGIPLLQVHSYIITGRLDRSMPISFLSKLASITGFEKALWKSFIFFLYTGQTLYLEDHMRVIYRGFHELNLTGLVQKYSKILSSNLDVTNALVILKDALKIGDKDLISSAACFLAQNSDNCRDPETWINIANDNLTSILFDYNKVQ